MSAASRLAAADRQITRAGSNIGLNSAGVPGGISAVAVDGLIEAGGLTWRSEDAEPWSSSIGYQLAAELGVRKVDLVKAGAS